MAIFHLHLTPITQRDKYLILVNDDIPLFMPHGRFELFVKALGCLVTKPQGSFMAQDLSIDRVYLYKIVERQRNDFNAVLGAENRDAFITHLGNGRYRIGLDTDQVAVDPGLEELVPHDLASRDVELLFKHFTTRPCNVSDSSARTFYDSVQVTKAKETTTKPLPPNGNRQDAHAEMAKGILMTSGILVTDSVAQSCAFLEDVQRETARRYALPVEINVAHLTTNGVATVFVSNVGCLFTAKFTFRYCSAAKFPQHAIEFAQAQRDS